MENITLRIKEYAYSLGFDACGICKAEEVDLTTAESYKQWLELGYEANMDYQTRNTDKRLSPTLLVEGAKSIISLALNYYPQQMQEKSAPQFAYYAYGKDYHDVMKTKLNQLLQFIQQIVPETLGRVFCDTAPLLERYWAAKAGLGFIGKNSLLIIPRKGSYFFLGEVIIDLGLEYDKPLNINCGNCSKCIDSCPTKAIEKPFIVNSHKCISYQTIENKKEISSEVKPYLENRIYGCDTCQQVCPWNKFAIPHTTVEFMPNNDFLNLTYHKLATLEAEEYRRIFKGSAIKRAKYEGLMRNLKALL